MEIEQFISRFRKNPTAQIVPTSNIFNIGREGNFLFNNSINKKNYIIKKFSSKCYQQLDFLLGLESFFIVNFSDDFFQSSLHDVLELLVSNKLLSYSFSDIRFNDAPFFYRMDILPHYPRGITDGRIVEKTIGHGFGKEPEQVFSKAIGEFLERFFLTLYSKKNFILASVNDLIKKRILFLDLDLLAGFSEEQKKAVVKRQFNKDTLFWWEKVKRISTNEDVYVPAQLVYWNYNHQETESYLCENNTNGAGGYFTKEGAILAGLYELIQRDSFLIYWLNGLTPRIIDPKTIPSEDFQTLLKESERYGFEIYCLNITADIGVPTFAVVISDSTGKGPCFSLGAGCQADPLKALYRAFEEAWSVYYWIRPRPAYPALNEDFKPFQERIGQDERLRLWANPEMSNHFKFFISGKKEPFTDFKFDYPNNFFSQKEELDFIVKRIEKLGPGYEVYYFQAQHPILSELGYYSVQVIIPQFISLYLNEYNAPLGALRLKEVPKKIGFSPALKFNPFPHPFP